MFFTSNISSLIGKFTCSKTKGLVWILAYIKNQLISWYNGRVRLSWNSYYKFQLHLSYKIRNQNQPLLGNLGLVKRHKPKKKSEFY